MAEPRAEAEWPVPWEPVHGTVDGPGARLSYRALAGAVAVLSALPSGAVDALGGALARVARRADAKRTRAAREFIDQALGPGLPPAELDRRVLRAWKHLFRVVYEAEVLHRHLDPARPLDRIELDLCPELEALRGSGKGCVLVSPHLGNWEAGVAVMAHLDLGPVYAVARPPKNKPMSVATQAAREQWGVRILHRNGAMQSLPKIIRAGGTVALLLDQRGRGRSVVAPYFGRPALCERSAGVLLRRLGAPVMVGACFLTERPFHYRVRIPRYIDPARLARLSPEGVATAVNLCMEELVRERPEQYFWLHDRYRKAPAALPDAERLLEEARAALGEAAPPRAAGGSPSGSEREAADGGAPPYVVTPEPPAGGGRATRPDGARAKSDRA